jgi:hypothetical protein
VAVFSVTNRAAGAIDGLLESGVMVMAIASLIPFLVLQRCYARGFISGALRG